MILIIAGGRNYDLSPQDYSKIESLHLNIGITEVVCGTPYGQALTALALVLE